MLDRLLSAFGLMRKPPFDVPDSGHMSVMCCRCSRLMGKSGKPIYSQTPLDFTDAAKFETAHQCNAAALRAGWSITEGNHRCPDCQRVQESMFARTGAIIDTRTGERADVR